MPTTQKIQPITVGVYSFKFKQSAWGAYVCLIKHNDKKAHEIRLNNELFVWDKFCGSYISVSGGQQLTHENIVAFKNRVDSTKVAKLTRTNDRIPVIVSTIYDTGAGLRKAETLGIQFWTAEMITTGASANTDGAISNFIDYN